MTDEEKRLRGGQARTGTPAVHRVVLLMDPSELSDLDGYVLTHGGDRSSWIRWALKKAGIVPRVSQRTSQGRKSRKK